VEVPASYEEGLRNIEIGTADIVMEIPRHLERDWMNGEDTHILIAANAVNGTKGGLGSSYLSSIINDMQPSCVRNILQLLQSPVLSLR
jgi:ABC-2 type transport system permease protein